MFTVRAEIPLHALKVSFRLYNKPGIPHGYAPNCAVVENNSVSTT